MKKGLIIVMVLLVLLGGVGCYLALRFKLEVTLSSNLDVPFGTDVNLKDFIISSNATFKDKHDTYYSLGEQEVKIEYIDSHNKTKEYSFKINVIDIGKPFILANATITSYKGENVSLLKNVICADYEDDNVSCEVIGEYDINTIGSYKLKYLAKDSSLNEETKDFTLNIIKKPSYIPPSNNKINYIPFKEIYDKHKNQNTMIGIDISRFQGDIDFNKVRDAGCEYVIIRLGWLVDGELGLDYKYEENIAKAKEAGLKIGLYFYSEAKTMKETIDSVNFIVDNIKYDIDLPIAYDWEDFNHYNDYHLSIYNFNKLAYTFMDLLNEKGYKGMLYASKYYLVNMWRASVYPVWVAQYYDYVTYEGDYIMWQITDRAKIDGITNGVDVDIYYLNR